MGTVSPRLRKSVLNWPDAVNRNTRRKKRNRVAASSELFQLHQRIPMSSGPLAVGVLDANTDGWPDLVLPSGWLSGQFFIAFNRPDGDQGRAFQARTLGMCEAPADNAKLRATKGLGLHDFDNDGRMDIYLANGDRGGPGLAPDGKKSVRKRFASSINSVQLNRGRETLRPMTLASTVLGARCVGAVFRLRWRRALRFLSQRVTLLRSRLGRQPVRKRAASRNAGLGSVWPRHHPRVLPDPGFWQDEHGRGIKLFKATLVRDLDGDGMPDIVTGAYADIWGGSFRRLQTPEDAKLDLDKDGIPDTTWPGYWDRGLFVLRNVASPGKIRFEDVSNAAVKNAYSDGSRQPQMHVYSILAADIDHDGDLDLLVNGPRNAARIVRSRTPHQWPDYSATTQPQATWRSQTSRSSRVLIFSTGRTYPAIRCVGACPISLPASRWTTTTTATWISSSPTVKTATRPLRSIPGIPRRGRWTIPTGVTESPRHDEQLQRSQLCRLRQ